jgi:4a-hydroxytetrahydrobiopterin dehydratase
VAKLSDAEITQALQSLPEWQRSGDSVERTIRFPEFMDGIRFIGRVAELAEAADHHPDIDIRYRNVRFVLSTHSEGGLTEKDVQLAHQIDKALG